MNFLCNFSNRPEETEWDGGTFQLSMTFSEEYPNKAPKVKFITKMFHPNSKIFLFLTCTYKFLLVYNDGSICLDIL